MYVICIYHYISTYIIFYPHRFDAWNIVLKKKKHVSRGVEFAEIQRFRLSA